MIFDILLPNQNFREISFLSIAILAKKRSRINFRGLLAYAFAHKKLKNSSFGPKILNLVTYIGIMFSDFKYRFWSTIKIDVKNHLCKNPEIPGIQTMMVAIIIIWNDFLKRVKVELWSLIHRVYSEIFFFFLEFSCWISAILKRWK